MVIVAESHCDRREMTTRAVDVKPKAYEER